VLEGIDGSGTTTQIRELARWLEGQGHRVHPTREPSDGPIGVLIRQALRGRLLVRSGPGGAEPLAPDTFALLFAADRLDHVQAEIRPHLEAGAFVLSDRYVDSSLAYQSADLDLAWVEALNSRAMAPDLTLFLDVPVSIALARIGIRQGEEREHFESQQMLERVAARYETVLRRAEEAGRAVVRIDGTQGPAQVAAEITAAVAKVI
jgi:dTMP kinase